MHNIENFQPAIITELGQFSKEKFISLINIRSTVLSSIRKFLIKEGLVEVTTSSLVNICGSCENPYASFTLNYYGREAHLSQSAQLQLEALVIRLKKSVFTVNNSFREENYDDPQTNGRRLSEFTLIEPEIMYEGLSPAQILKEIMESAENLIKTVIEEILVSNKKDLLLLGSKVDYLESLLTATFETLSYDEALSILNSTGGSYKFGDDLGIAEERKILAKFDNIPTFITYYPAQIKFFNMKRTTDGRHVYSVDLLTPMLGETAGGAVREENGEKIKNYLLSSRIAEYLKNKGSDPEAQFREYLNLFQQEKPVQRGGFGVGFERLIGFLLNSTDILETVAYRSMRPARIE